MRRAIRLIRESAYFLDVVQVVEGIANACTLSARIVVEANMGGISALMA